MKELSWNDKIYFNLWFTLVKYVCCFTIVKKYNKMKKFYFFWDVRLYIALNNMSKFLDIQILINEDGGFKFLKSSWFLFV